MILDENELIWLCCLVDRVAKKRKELSKKLLIACAYAVKVFIKLSDNRN